MKPVVLLLLTLLTSGAWAQDQEQSETERKTFTTVERIGEDSFRSFYMFTVSGHEYTIRADGRGERSSQNARARDFTLKVDQGRIVQMYYLEYEKDLLLMYQASDRQGLHGFVVRLNQTTLLPVWTKPFKDVNPEIAEVAGGTLSIKGQDATMKIDLRTGALVGQ
jgi:hypothetical protein